VVDFFTPYYLENPQDYQRENGRFYVTEETKKKLNQITPAGKQDIYMLALIETLDEIRKLLDEYLSAIQTP